MQEKIEVNEHADNIVKAITALMPSRNYIVQFLSMLPADFPTMYNTFPELLEDEKTRKALEMAFGVSFGEQVEVRGYNKLGRILIDFYSQIFEALKNEDVIKGLSQLLGTDENIPTPEAEWLGLRLQGLAMEPNYGQEAASVLKAVKEIAEEINKDYTTYEASLDRVSKKTSVGEERIHYVIGLLLKYKLVEKVTVTEEEDGNYSNKEGIKFADSLKNHVEMIDSALK